MPRNTTTQIEATPLDIMNAVCTVISTISVVAILFATIIYHHHAHSHKHETQANDTGMLAAWVGTDVELTLVEDSPLEA